MTEELTRIAVVVRPHGIRGELVVAAEGDTLASLRAGEPLWLADEPDPRQLLALRPHKGRWLVTVDSVPDRTAAEALRGAPVRVRGEVLEELEETELWAHDVVGYRVETQDGTRIGTVKELVTASPHDLLEIEQDGVAVLVPMVRDWLVELSRDERRMILQLPPGLLEATAERRS